MEAVFLKLLNMSITASWLALAVILLRILLKKAPKSIRIFMWGLVALRLVCPVSIKTVFSLIPSVDTLPKDFIYSAEPRIHSGISSLNMAVNPIISEGLAPSVGASVNPAQIISFTASVVWLAGMVAMLIYALVSYFIIKRRVREAVPFKDNIFVCDRIATPFILGIIRPRIYLPSEVENCDLEYIIAHERAHIKRLDHIWKPLGFLLLSVYWFNPVLWIAYVLLCRDIELACDEKVIKKAGGEEKKSYSNALINCSVDRKRISACPLAFGEVGVKGRIKAVLSYKKPAFWIIVVAILLCAILTLCFLTDPVSYHLYDIEEGAVYITLLDDVEDVEIVKQGSDLLYSIEKSRVDEFVSGLGRIEIKKSPISQSRSEDRAKDYEIKLYYKSSEQVTDIYFNSDLTEVWINDGVKPTFSYPVTNPDTAKKLVGSLATEILGADTTEAYDEPLMLGGTKKLTLEDVIKLQKERGGALDWRDFEDYIYYETGSGLYIRAYDIDEMFYLRIGGSPKITDGKAEGGLMYIYLCANDKEGHKIDLRSGDAESFIEAYKDSPVTTQESFGYYCCAVDYSGDNFELLGIPQKAYYSSVRALPAYQINSTEELLSFKERTKDNFDFDRKYEDTLSFNEATEKYTAEFFEENALILSYAAAGTDADRFSVDYVTGSDGILSIGVAEHIAEAGNDVMQGWLICISIPKQTAEKAEEIEAYISATVHPYREWFSGDVEKVYVLEESDEVLKPVLTLYKDGRFQFTTSALSSYLGIGNYILEDGRLTLSTDDGLNIYNFTQEGENMVFDADASSPLPSYSTVTHGSVFRNIIGN